jgi:putative membrane protein (TIGR04086 family)
MPNEKRDGGGKTLLRSAFSACFGYLICVILLLLEALLVEKSILPEQVMELVCWIVVGISALCTALFSAGKSEKRILGSFCGIVAFFLLAFVSGFLLGGEPASERIVLMCGILVANAFLGAIFSGLIWR